MSLVREHIVFRFGKRTYDLSSRTHLMGVLNITPDSFSDGGRFLTREAAREHALRMIDDGADFIDVGGESTRPRGQAYGEGAEAVSLDEELERVIPVVGMLARETDVPISIDTYKSDVAREALKAGASIVNDISGFTFDQTMPAVVAEAGASAVVMHIQGTPKTMQQNPSYEDLMGEICAFLDAGVEQGQTFGHHTTHCRPGYWLREEVGA